MTEPLDERAAFEFWAANEMSWVFDRDLDRPELYDAPSTQDGWRAWQARADLASASKVDSNGWMSVEDRLPEVGVHVIVYMPDAYKRPLAIGCRKAALDSGAIYWDVKNAWSTVRVSHWMPLPAPPNGGDVRPSPEAPEPDEQGLSSESITSITSLATAAPTVAQEPAAPTCPNFIEPRGCWNVRCQLGKQCINPSRNDAAVAKGASQEQPPQEPAPATPEQEREFKNRMMDVITNEIRWRPSK